MNKQALLILFLCSGGCLVGCKKAKKEQYFTSTIDYLYSYSSNFLNADSIAKARPAKGIFNYDGLNYQSTFIGPDTAVYYYSGEFNRCVSKTGSEGKFVCDDYGIVTDSVLSVKLYDTDEKVLGQACKILEMQKKSSWVKYYVSKGIKIAPGTYKLHKAYNWDEYGKKTEGGLILKLEHRFKSFTMSGIATSIKIVKDKFSALEINDSLFAQICQ